MKNFIAFFLSSLCVGLSIVAIVTIMVYPIFFVYQQLRTEIPWNYVVAGAVVTFAIGIITRYLYVSPLNAAAKAFLKVYSSFYGEFFRQGSRYFAKENKTRPFERVVEVRISETISVLGFLTNSIGSKRIIYLPTSRRLTSGLNLIVESTSVSDVDINSEEFIKFVVTSGSYEFSNATFSG